MNPFTRVLLFSLPLLLTACADGTVRDTLGLNRDAPDEFTVVSRPALSVPPEFNLRPPRPGAASPLQPSADATARGVILGKPAVVQPDLDAMATSTTPTAVVPVIANDTPTPAASSLLKRAGAENANDDIRTQLSTDVSTPADTSKARSLYEKLSGADKVEPVVDPKKEAERLRTNKDEGKPVTDGDVPVQDDKPKSIVDRIF